MADLQNKYFFFNVIYVIYNPVIADPDSMKFVRPEPF